MSDTLDTRTASGLTRDVAPAVAAMARMLAEQAGARAVLFYGSNLRTGSLEGVLDFYVLLDGPPEGGIWPRVSYREWTFAAEGERLALRAKIAAMTLAKFAEAASGRLLDTTIWTRFCQPSALVACPDPAAREAVIAAIASAVRTAARLAVAVGPKSGAEEEYWRALFEATYQAEFRMERASRARSIIELNREHFTGLLPAALAAQGLAFQEDGGGIAPEVPAAERARIHRWWKRRRRLGKPLNLVRLVRASATFEGAARYAAWKIERHTGVPVELTPWRERHPLLAAPGVLFAVWRARRQTRI